MKGAGRPLYRVSAIDLQSVPDKYEFYTLVCDVVLSGNGDYVDESEMIWAETLPG